MGDENNIIFIFFKESCIMVTSKSILFKGEIVSSGIVNFDGKPAWLTKQALRDRIQGQWHDNVKVAKHAISQIGTNENGTPIYQAVLKISHDCIRNSLFKDDQPYHNPAIVHADVQLLNHISSAASLIRGYMFADKGLKKKTSAYISDAKQVCNNVSTIDIGTQDAPRSGKVDADSDGGLSMHYKETIGGLVRYEFYGAVDICELQFISVSQVYDRLAVDPNYLDAYIERLEKVLGSKVSKKAYYIRKSSTNGLPEEGILLTPDQVRVLIGEFFKRMFDLEIVRGANGRAWLSKLEITTKSGGLDFGKNGTLVTDVAQVLNIVGVPHIFYDEYSYDEAKKLYDTLDEGKLKKALEKSAAKASKEATKASKKSAKKATDEAEAE